MEYSVAGVVRVRVTDMHYLVEEPELSPKAAEAVEAITEWLALRGLEPTPDAIAMAADHLGYSSLYMREATALEYHVRRLMKLMDVLINNAAVTKRVRASLSPLVTFGDSPSLPLLYPPRAVLRERASLGGHGASSLVTLALLTGFIPT